MEEIEMFRSENIGYYRGILSGLAMLLWLYIFFIDGLAAALIVTGMLLTILFQLLWKGWW